MSRAEWPWKDREKKGARKRNTEHAGLPHQVVFTEALTLVRPCCLLLYQLV